MAKNVQSSNRICHLKFRPFSFIVLVCLLEIKQVSGIECGTVAFLDEMPTTRIFKGTVTSRANWPFIAAIHLNNGSALCGGTIISTRHILTAAHCIKAKGAGKQREKGEIEVRLGAYNLTAKDEEGVVQRNVFEVHVHPDWNPNRDNYDADLAILELSEYVVFTNNIRPICLPAMDAYVDGAFIDVRGVIVGWGLDQNKIFEEIPKEAGIQALNDSHCYRNFIGVVPLSSPRTFCGIGIGTPNRGDSGGGFFVDIDYVWRQYGIISSISVKNDGKVDSNMASVYTNVKAFRDWIVEIVSKSELIVGGVNVRCEYLLTDLGYECHLYDLDIKDKNIMVESLTGSHKDGRTDHDVEGIKIINGTMPFLPSGIGNLFRNLKYLKVGANKFKLGTERIRRSEFQNMTNLEGLIFFENDIETVEEFALWNLPNLNVFVLYRNKIKELHETTFEKNVKLAAVDLESNQLEFLPRNLFRHNVALTYVNLKYNRIEVIEIDFAGPKQIYLEGNVCIGANSDSFENWTEFLNLIKNNCSRIET